MSTVMPNCGCRSGIETAEMQIVILRQVLLVQHSTIAPSIDMGLDLTAAQCKPYVEDAVQTNGLLYG